MRFTTLLLTFALCLLASAPDAAPVGATISGRVSVIDGGKPVARPDVYVYVESLGKRKSKKPPGEGILETITQDHETFVPHVVVVPVGAEVAFPNVDHKDHNVFSPTDPPGQFDLDRNNYDTKGKRHQFVDAAEMDIYCDIHPQMTAKVKVIDSSYFGKVIDGSFTLTGIPPGTYKVVAWAPDSQEVKSEKLVVGENATITLADELHLQAGRPPKSHRRKDNTSYPATQYKTP
jgi:plastocyanin